VFFVLCVGESLEPCPRPRLRRTPHRRGVPAGMRGRASGQGPGRAQEPAGRQRSRKRGGKVARYKVARCKVAKLS